MLSETGRKKRAAAVSVCAASAIAAGLLAPLAARPSSGAFWPKAQADLATRTNTAGSPWEDRTVVIARDPFLPAAEPRTALPIVDVHAVAIPFPVSVRAIAVGDNSRALIDVDGLTRLVGVGDSVGSLRIASIQIDRVVFSDGSAAKLEGTPP